MFGLVVPILIGFAMATLGLALLFLGDVPFLGGKRIGAVRARFIGLVLLSYLPLAFASRLAINALFGNDVVDGPLLLWCLFGACWFAVGALLFRVVSPKRQPRNVSSKSSDKSSFSPTDLPTGVGEAEVVWTTHEPADHRPAKKSTRGQAPKAIGKPAAEESNPFDFS